MDLVDWSPLFGPRPQSLATVGTGGFVPGSDVDDPIDGGVPASVYEPSDIIDGGTP